MTDIVILLTNAGSPLILGIISIFLFGFLLYKKRWNESLIVFFSMGGGWVLQYSIKLLIHRSRPENALIPLPTSYSFPSGHATMAVIFFLLLIYIFEDRIENSRARIFFIIFNILAFLLVGLSRIYLNVHWVSDVLGGFGLGIVWLMTVIIATREIDSYLQKKK